MLQVIPNKALENSGRRVPFPINIVCKGHNKEALPPPNEPVELLRLGEIDPHKSILTSCILNSCMTRIIMACLLCEVLKSGIIFVAKAESHHRVTSTCCEKFESRSIIFLHKV